MFLYLHRMRRVDILCKCSSCVTSAKSSAQSTAATKTVVVYTQYTPAVCVSTVFVRGI